MNCWLHSRSITKPLRKSRRLYDEIVSAIIVVLLDASASYETPNPQFTRSWIPCTPRRILIGNHGTVVYTKHFACKRQKVKVHTPDIASLRSESPPQRRSGMARVLKGFHSFTCTSTRSSAIGMSHTCLCLPSRSWYSFTDHGGMEG